MRDAAAAIKILYSHLAIGWRQGSASVVCTSALLVSVAALRPGVRRGMSRGVATVHLICGPVGAGKTTLARRIAAEHGALRCSRDEWVMHLLGAGSVCESVLAQQVGVVLDFGFLSVAERKEHRERALRSGASVHLHVVTARPALRWQRVLARNHDRAETFALLVTEPMFQGSESWWRPPTAEERAGAITFHESDAPVRG